MAIQVNGTTVIDNSRNLTNIASVDAATVAALTAAGVGAPSADWVDLPNSYSWSFTSTFSPGYDSGMLNISTILSGLPTDWKYLAIIQKAKMTSAPTTSYYGYQSGVHYLRLGTSSSSYTEKSSGSLELALQGYFYASSYGAPYNELHEKWGFFIIDSSYPSSIFQKSLFNNPSVGGPMYATNRGAIDSFSQVLPPVGSIGTTQYWNADSIGPGQSPTSWGTGTLSNLSYCGYRFGGYDYSSQDGSAPNFTVTMKASYIAS